MRVNGISAGLIKTLAASGIKDFSKMLAGVAKTSPIRRNVTIDEVGNVAAFLSDSASGVSAEITYVDGGFSQVVGGLRPRPKPSAGRFGKALCLCRALVRATSS